MTRRARRWLALALGVALLLAGAAVWLWVERPWIPAVELAEPGPGGRQVGEGGVIGNFYPGKGDGPCPAVLLLGGSEGGLAPPVDRQARALAARGYAVLALAYYRLPGQPERLAEVPLESFTRALDWLARQPEVDRNRLAIMGTSKGAEAALLVASRRPDVRAVVAAMPSHVVWQGFDWTFVPVATSSWSEGGRPVPWMPYATGRWTFDVYRPALEGGDPPAEALIPVERIAGPVLLLCGEEDSLWPSCPMARAIKARRQAAGGLATALLGYPDAGHLGAGLPLPPGSDPPPALARFGGTVAGNAAARADGWPRLLAFLETTLRPVRMGDLP